MAQFINFGTGREGSLNISAANLGGVPGFGVATVTGTAGQYSCVKTDVGYFNTGNGGRDGDMVMIHQSQGTGAGQWEVNYIVSTSGTTVNLLYPLTYTYGTGAQMYTSPQLYNGTVSGNLVPYAAWGASGAFGGIIFLVDKGTLTISGSISVSGAGFVKGGAVSSTGTGRQGEGTVAAGGTQSNAANGNGGGAGTKTGMDAASGGGGGGNGSAGGDGSIGQSGSVGIGGSTSGLANLTVMTFGGAGGSGGNGARDATNGLGGNGSGIVLIIAKNFTTSSGTIVLNGSNGSNGTTSSSYWTGGGGGAGGSCLIKCQTAVLGTNKIVANGGAGGSGSDGGGAGWNKGGNGGVGRIHIDYSDTISGTTTPTLDSTQITTLKSQVYSSMI